MERRARTRLEKLRRSQGNPGPGIAALALPPLKSSPTPWREDPTAWGGCIGFVAANGKQVGRWHAGREDQGNVAIPNKADREFILEAVNNYESMRGDCMITEEIKRMFHRFARNVLENRMAPREVESIIDELTEKYRNMLRDEYCQILTEAREIYERR